MQKSTLFRIALLALLSPAAWISSASAYDTYASGGVSPDRTGNCATCHGDFRAPNYASLSDGAAWTGVYTGTPINSLHDIHRRLIAPGCDTCHTAGSRIPTLLDSSTGIVLNGTTEYTISCLGCHGRAETAEAGTVTSAGLRQHHQSAGVTVCADCHADTISATFATVGEQVLPPYYPLVDPARLTKPNDSCNPDGNETFAGLFGLDNDGDGVYDYNDLDCPATPFIKLSSAALNFNVVPVGSSATLNTVIQNLGRLALNVSLINLCAGTSSEFTWLPAAPFIVAPNSSQTLAVTFTPVDNVSDTGCLAISSDAPNEAITQLAVSSQAGSESKLLPLYIPAIIRPAP